MGKVWLSKTHHEHFWCFVLGDLRDVYIDYHKPQATQNKSAQFIAWTSDILCAILATANAIFLAQRVHTSTGLHVFEYESSHTNTKAMNVALFTIQTVNDE